MQDRPNLIDTPMTGLGKGDWLEQLSSVADDLGHYQPLGRHHMAAFIGAGSTLLVSFETLGSILGAVRTGRTAGLGHGAPERLVASGRAVRW